MIHCVLDGRSPCTYMDDTQVFGQLSSFEPLELDVDRLVLGLRSSVLQLEIHVHDSLSFFARSLGRELLTGLLDAKTFDLAGMISDRLRG